MSRKLSKAAVRREPSLAEWEIATLASHESSSTSWTAPLCTKTHAQIARSVSFEVVLAQFFPSKGSPTRERGTLPTRYFRSLTLRATKLAQLQRASARVLSQLYSSLTLRANVTAEVALYN